MFDIYLPLFVLKKLLSKYEKKLVSYFITTNTINKVKIISFNSISRPWTLLPRICRRNRHLHYRKNCMEKLTLSSITQSILHWLNTAVVRPMVIICHAHVVNKYYTGERQYGTNQTPHHRSNNNIVKPFNISIK